MAETYGIRITPRATADLQGIFDHISKSSPTNAARMIETILAAIDGLTVLPFRYTMPRPGNGRSRSVRSMPVWPYLVRYRVEKRTQTVFILRIRHGARQRP